jgi:hypothetical protein
MVAEILNANGDYLSKPKPGFMDNRFSGRSERKRYKKRKWHLVMR